MNERLKRIIALEKVMTKTKPLSAEASTKEIAEALIILILTRHLRTAFVS